MPSCPFESHGRFAMMADNTDPPDPEREGISPERPARRPRRHADFDDEDRDEPDIRVRSGGDEGVSTLIPYRNPKALTAYYCGVFSLIPCIGLVLGPVAFVFGCMGMSYVNKNPTAKGTGHAIAGIVLGALTSLANWGCVGISALQILMGPKR
jgi:hypothetical protein